MPISEMEEYKAFRGDRARRTQLAPVRLLKQYAPAFVLALVNAVLWYFMLSHNAVVFSLLSLLGFVGLPLAQFYLSRRGERSQGNDSLHRVESDIERLLRELSRPLRDAEVSLDTAQSHFDQSTFSAFWDEIESATSHLAAFDQLTRRLSQYIGTHSSIRKRSSPAHPLLSIQNRIPDPRPITNRLAVLCKKGQSNYHFASIYEHRRTNAILIAGFSTLGQAVSEMGSRIESSLNSMSQQLSCDMDSLLRSMGQIQSLQASQLGQARVTDVRLQEIEKEATRRRY